MKLLYLKAKNILSFGDEGGELEFGPYNVIAGPNDSGKTNLFRTLNIIEDSFKYRHLPIEGLIFKDETTKPLSLEVGIQLDDVEIDLLSTLLICTEMVKMKDLEKQQDQTDKVTDNKNWELILKKYGQAIISKSFEIESITLLKRVFEGQKHPGSSG